MLLVTFARRDSLKRWKQKPDSRRLRSELEAMMYRQLNSRKERDKVIDVGEKIKKRQGLSWVKKDLTMCFSACVKDADKIKNWKFV